MLMISTAKKSLIRYTPILSLILSIWLDQIFLRPWGLSGPIITSIMIYYWALYRPESISALWLFVLGLYQDLLMHIPFGISTSAYVVLYLFMFFQRRVLIWSSFMTIWGCFLVSAILVQTVFWLATFFIYKVLPPLRPCLYSLAFSVLMYPLFTRILIYCHQIEENRVEI